MALLNDTFYPENLKNMNLSELELLCSEIRADLLERVSETGGHLASNLGVVELTVAMHYVFQAPKDKIVWDVGHQSYVHKMLTGRRGAFSSLRQLDGLSGFPKRSESAYDTFDTGHSSTSISAALGMAKARDLQGEDYAVAAVIGDGALTGGMAYEALNNAGVIDTGMIVVLNDNEMSIAKNHGGIPQYLGKLRTSEKYTSFKSKVKKAVKKIPKVGDRIYKGLASCRDLVKYMIVPGILFEELGFVYLGPVDGHKLADLIEVLKQAYSLRKPVVVHCVTKKGKGFLPAEMAPSHFHGVAPFDIHTGKPKKEKTAPTWSDIFGKKLCEMADKDSRITAVSAAMIEGTGLSEFAGAHKDRIFDVGIAEEHAVTFAAGMAVSGLRPVVAIYSTFLQRAYDQIVIDVCMQKLPVLFCLDRAGIVGADGETHHGIFDLAYLRSIPNLTVLLPSDSLQLEQMMEYALTLDGPCAIRYPRGEAPLLHAPEYRWRPQPEPVRSGRDITIISFGKMLPRCMQAAEILAEEQPGCRCEIIDACILHPLTKDAERVYRESAARTHCILTVEDGVTVGGGGSSIAELFADSTNVAVHILGWPDQFIPQGSQAELEQRYGLDARSITEKVRKIIEGTT